jgi:2-polyprenyl-3-methyl-5-hydroxy-6-metoxy-1,4-benzoquinol methylase
LCGSTPQSSEQLHCYLDELTFGFDRRTQPFPKAALLQLRTPDIRCPGGRQVRETADMTTAADNGPSWSDIATWYDALLRAGSGPHETATACLLGLVPQLTDAEVLDLACGQGLATRALAGAGAPRVVGVDATRASSLPMPP